MYDLNRFLEAEETNLDICKKTQEKNYDIKFNKVINDLTELQKTKAIAVHGIFKNSQEFYSTLLEEIQETTEEIDVIKKQLDHIWQEIRNNNDEKINHYLEYIIKHGKNAIAELIQVIAVCEKMERK